jgi:hypothetical protein
MEDFRNGVVAPGQFKDAELWGLRQGESGSIAFWLAGFADTRGNVLAYESSVHPQTGETVPAALRLAAFVPVNIPICVGMLLAPSTVRDPSPTLSFWRCKHSLNVLNALLRQLGNTIFWQWVNQSYSAGFNYANRNASSEQDNMTILSTSCASISARFFRGVI